MFILVIQLVWLGIPVVRLLPGATKFSRKKAWKVYAGNKIMGG
jgi:hypothetical protein